MKQSMVNIVWMGDAISPITPLCMKFYIQKDMYVRLNVYNLAGGGTTRCRVMRYEFNYF